MGIPVEPRAWEPENGALANVTVDPALHDAVPSMFRQSPEDGERRSLPASDRIRDQAGSHKQTS